MRFLNGATEDDNYTIIDAVRQTIFNRTGGILQADNEGFTNERGYHILWQFHDNVTGELDCAVLNNGRWLNFTMDLGDDKHRQAFKSGKIPPTETKLSNFFKKFGL